MSTCATIIQHSFGSPGQGSQKRIRNKRILIGKEVELSLLRDGMILYIEFYKDDIEKLVEQISEYSKVTAWKINTQKPLHPYTITKQINREIKGTIPFIIATKRIKYLGIRKTFP